MRAGGGHEQISDRATGVHTDSAGKLALFEPKNNRVDKEQACGDQNQRQPMPHEYQRDATEQCTRRKELLLAAHRLPLYRRKHSANERKYVEEPEDHRGDRQNCNLKTILARCEQ